MVTDEGTAFPEVETVDERALIDDEQQRGVAVEKRSEVVEGF
jgi:hypothetical protein